MDVDQIDHLRGLFIELYNYTDETMNEGWAYIVDVMNRDSNHNEKQTEGRLFEGDTSPRKMTADDKQNMKDGLEYIRRGATYANWALAVRDAAVEAARAHNLPDADDWPVWCRSSR